MGSVSDRIQALSPEKRALLARRNPLSFAQRRLWFLDQLEPGSASYSIPVAFRFTGRLDVRALAASLDRIVARHAILRTTFPAVDGQPLQIVLPVAPAFVPVVDLQGLPRERRDGEALRLATAEAHSPFDLEAGPLLRFSLLRLAPEEHVFQLNVHHILCDGWSQEILVREMSALYQAEVRGVPPGLPEPRLQYGDYARWQQGWLQGDQARSQLAFWKERLRGSPPLLELPADRPRGAVAGSDGGVASRALPAGAVAGLTALKNREAVSFFMVYLAAFKVLLYRLTGQRDLSVGTPIVNRGRAEIEGMIGLFLNMLVLRTGDLSGGLRFRELLHRVRQETLAAYDHQDLPFEMLVDELNPERNLGVHPLFQVMFTEVERQPWAAAWDGLRIQLFGVERRFAKYDLTLNVSAGPERVLVTAEWRTALFDATTVERWLGHFAALVAAAAADPDRGLDELPLVSPGERWQMLGEWNDTAAAWPAALCVHEQFGRQAAASPEATALVCDGRQLTYAELDRRADLLAAHLVALGVGPETPVGLHLERSPEMVAAMLGVLKAGGAYVPLDPSFPAERLAFMAADAGLRVLLTDGGADGPLARAVENALDPAALLAAAPAPPAGPAAPGAAVAENAAYILYTSGSTGRPKGVRVPHRALANFLAAMAARPGLSAGDVLLSVTTLSFDIAALEIFLPLLAGARLVLARRETVADGAALARALADCGATVMQGTPATWRLLLGAGWRGDGRLKVLCGGEALAPELAAALAAAGGEVWNLYGPTETTVWSAVGRVAADAGGAGNAGNGGPVAIGRPIANTRIYLLDPAGEIALPGVPGDLYIGGDGLARDYLGRPELTAAGFVPDPFGGQPGARLYRTGDRARLTADGRLLFLGRADKQTKLRGYRIELGEIEAALARHPAVAQAVAEVRPGPGGEGSLVAYLVAREAAVASPVPALPPPAELQRHLRLSLPPYMVPAFYVFLDRLPLTPNGKVDRRALPAPEALSRGGDRVLVPAQTPLQERILDVWQEVLKLPAIGVHDNFFDLGGHSILATQVVARLRERLQAEVSLRDFFEHATVAGLAGRIETALRARAGLPAPPLVRQPGGGPAPLSFAQQRLWFLDQLVPGNPFYNLTTAVRIEKGLDLALLRRSLREVVRRHEALRTAFVTVGSEPVQTVLPPGESWLAVDLRGLGDAAGAAAQGIARAAAGAPFDLARGPLLRTVVILEPDGAQQLLLTMHHIVSDAWSLGVLAREIAVHYQAFLQASAPPLPELPVQYADFARWQRGLLAGEPLRILLDYWRGRLDPDLPPLELPVDRPRPAVRSFRGRRQAFRLAAGPVEALRGVTRGRGVTLFALAMAAFNVLLYRYSGSRTLAVGFPVANRGRVELEDLIGFFANTLVLRTDLEAGLPFADLLREVGRASLDALVHQDMPFERLVELLQPDRALNQNPLFQVMLVLQNTPAPALEGEDLGLRSVAVESGVARFDWTLFLAESGGGLAGSLEYDADLFDAVTAARAMDHFQRLLAGIAAAPAQRVGDLVLLSEGERHQVVREWNAAAAPAGAAEDVVERFDRQAEIHPEVPAVRLGGLSLTYRELSARANELAWRLQSLGVGPDVVVPLHFERSLELAVGVLGVLKAGGAYLPLDPAHPRQRLAYILDEAGSPVVLTGPGGDGGALFGERPGLHRLEVTIDKAVGVLPTPRVRATPGSLAYVLYTSGSTGRPKGVAMPRGALANLIDWQVAESGAAPGERTLQFAAYTFDVSFQEIFATWCAGGTLVMVPEAVRQDIPALLQEIAAARVARLFLPFVALQHLAEEAAGGRLAPPALREVATAGEQLRITPEIAALCRLSGSRLQNQYGPTEAHVVSAFTLEGAPEAWPLLPPIGRPLPGLQLRVLDEGLQPAPAGVVGELYLGGAGLARGYFRRPALTAEKFVPDPAATAASVPGARLYRTGDLARHRPDGNVEFLGRTDHQVKVRGFRVELGEIEAVLCRHPQVRQAVAVAREDAGRTAVVAYVVPAEEGAPPAVPELRRWLKEELPAHMVPSALAILESLPLTRSGKVDRLALPAPQKDRSGSDQELAPALTQVDEVIAGIWRQVLGCEEIGVHDNFFDLGGHSLLATRVVSRMREAFQVDVPLRLLFERPTIAGLAEKVEAELRAGAGVDGPAVERVPRDRPLPLSFAQQRLWFLDQLDPANASYNLSNAVQLAGPLVPAALERSLAELLRRHEVLRTTFAEADGEPYQVMVPAAGLPLPLVDLQALPPEVRDAEVRRLGRAVSGEPFDLGRGPLLRTALLRAEPQRHVLLLVLHHIVADAWSLRLLVEEVGVLYAAFAAGRPSPLPELPVQYADFAAWQRSWLQGAALERSLAYWRQQLAGAPLLLLPTDRPRPAADLRRGGRLSFTVPAATCRALKEICRAEGVTLFMALLAAFQCLLSFTAGQDDVVIGADIANRNRRETEKLIGFFVNMLVLRGDLAGNPTFRQLLVRAREVALGAFAHQDLPYDRLIEELRPRRSAASAALFHVVFNFDNTGAAPAAAPGGEASPRELRLESLDLERTAVRFELALAMGEQGGSLQGHWLYSADLFDRETVDRLRRRLEAILELVVADPAIRCKQLELATAPREARGGLERQDRKQQLLRGIKPKAIQVPSAGTESTEGPEHV